ncbi:MAG: glycosyltransferase involved in cell wall biosynthesis [Desulforhopalus sp.]|jgi:glycosyltransferase involved in cell wall biosynthesis
MKILHINSQSQGGAFNGTYRLHMALLKKGIKSKVLVLNKINKTSDLEEVYTFNVPFRKATIFNRLSTQMGVPYTAVQKKWLTTKKLDGEFEVISFPISDYDITQSTHYKEADIINLHWTGNYLDYPSFFKKNTKPVVFTLRDSNPLLGIFHLQKDLERNYSSWQNIEIKNRLLKQKLIQNAKFKVRVIGISNWMTKLAQNSNIFKNIEAQTIHNCIDTNMFRPIKKEIARNLLNIDTDRIVFSFISDSIHRINKGYKEMILALNCIENTKIELLSIGNKLEQPCNYNVRHRHLGHLTPKDMRLVHSASDAFIFPTKEEALGNVMLEAMACGTPVIGTPVGGLLDVIKPSFNGVFSKDINAEGLKDAIEQFIQIKDSFDSDKIRDYIKNNFSEELIASKYIKIYQELLIG